MGMEIKIIYYNNLKKIDYIDFEIYLKYNYKINME